MDLKGQLDEIIENEVKGSILRSLCKDYEDGEKCSKYFFSLEKVKFQQKTITSLSEKGHNLILKTLDFYSKTYTYTQNLNLDLWP